MSPAFIGFGDLILSLSFSFSKSIKSSFSYYIIGLSMLILSISFVNVSILFFFELFKTLHVSRILTTGSLLRATECPTFTV